MSRAAHGGREPLDRLQRAGIVYAIGILALIAALVGTGIAPIQRVDRPIPAPPPRPPLVAALRAPALGPLGTVVASMLTHPALPSPLPTIAPTAGLPTPLPPTPTPTATFMQTAAAFGQGEARGVALGPDGALGLMPSVDDDFDKGALDAAQWQIVPWGAGGGASVRDGTITLTIAAIRSRRAFVHRTLEARVRFTPGAQPLQNIAWSADLKGATAILIGEPPSDPGHLYARVKQEGAADRLALLPVSLDDGAYHVYRIAWGPEQVEFSVDGVVQVTIAAALDTPMYAWLSAASARPVIADWARVLDFGETTGSLTAAPVDAGAAVSWQTLTIRGAIPPGTAVRARTRTSADGVRWSEETAVGSDGGIASPPGRYLQYVLAFSGTPTSTPLVTAVAATAIPGIGGS